MADAITLKRIKDSKISVLMENETIGSGQYGKVYKGYLEKDEKQKFAIKVLSKEKFSSNKMILERLKRELTIMNSLSHENLMRHYHTMETANNYYLVLELCEGGTLASLLESLPGKFIATDEDAKKLMKEIIEGLYYLHEKNIIHRDLKPENILVSKDGTLKIGDFGFAKTLSSETLDISLKHTRVGTPYYMPPEVLKGGETSSKCDVWSCGVIFYEMLYGCYPFIQDKYSVQTPVELYNIFMKEKLVFPKARGINKVEELLANMLNINHSVRFTWTDVKKMTDEM